MKRIIKNLAHEGRRTELLWRYGFNILPSLAYRLKVAGATNAAERRVVGDLNRDGIAVATVDELFADRKYFTELDKAAKSLLDRRRDELEALKKSANDPAKIGEKTFNVELLGSRVEFDEECVFARFAIEETFLNIADSYFGMLVKLRYYNVWQTFATSGAARESQLWHFDREDNYILKVFLYLKDVDDGAGPFTYAPKTHRKGTLWGKQPEYSLENNVKRSTDRQMSQIVPAENWITAVGKKGTIVFADTRGFHKGGEARTSDRLMFTCMFTSPASDSRRLLKCPNRPSLAGLTKKQLCALEID